MGEIEEMNRRRDRIEVIVEVLELIDKGVTIPYRIYFAANLNHKMLMEILEPLVKTDCIEETVTTRGKRYRIKEKGKDIINAFHNLSNLVPDYRYLPTTLKVKP